MAKGRNRNIKTPFSAVSGGIPLPLLLASIDGLVCTQAGGLQRARSCPRSEPAGANQSGNMLFPDLKKLATTAPGWYVINLDTFGEASLCIALGYEKQRDLEYYLGM